ncbi:conserved hypothetical protein [Chlorobium limicola DSM 245]|uniref:Uncharacterized protein n=1 Tax=Chlorobium limicola (strain DSM 245 / NBRC 103803 / 6330) TaxID=290315 RepID=B3EH56_CHLL2|nr:conserved hypothetical protein [Chlorobium limicola DSM 245]
MNSEEFVSSISKSIPIGIEFDNPGGGTSIVKSITHMNISYKRGNSIMSVGLNTLYDTYKQFAGRQVTCSELKEYAPNIFDSKARPAGHSCNCTFFFLVLIAIGVVEEIQGAGVRGNPYYVDIQSP